MGFLLLRLRKRQITRWGLVGHPQRLGVTMDGTAFSLGLRRVGWSELSEGHLGGKEEGQTGAFLKKVVTRSAGGRGEGWETGHRSDKAERKGERVVGSSSLCSTFLWAFLHLLVTGGRELAAFSVNTYIILGPKKPDAWPGAT